MEPPIPTSAPVTRAERITAIDTLRGFALLGILLIATGFAIATGQVWARSVGIGFAVLSMIANFMFLPYYPVWSLLIIAIDVFVIWALCVFTREDARN